MAYNEVLTLGEYYEIWNINPLKDTWLTRDLIYKTKYSSEVEYEILSWWEKNKDKRVSNKEIIELLEKINMDNDYFVTTHWLTYIFDLQMPVEKIWGNFGIIHTLLRECYRKQDHKTIIELEEKENKKKILLKTRGEKITHRFLVAKPHCLYYRLLHTLDILNLFNYSLIYYLSEAFESYNPEEDEWMRFLAFSLHFLTYNIDFRDGCHDIRKKYINKNNIIDEVIKEYGKNHGTILII